MTKERADNPEEMSFEELRVRMRWNHNKINAALGLPVQFDPALAEAWWGDQYRCDANGKPIDFFGNPRKEAED